MPALVSRADTVSKPPSARAMVGTLLITWGVQLAVQIVTGLEITLWVLVLGSLILQRWFIGRVLPALVAGGLLVGAGVAAIVNDLVPGDGLDSFFRLCGWAFGFLLVASLGGRRTSWAYLAALGCGVGALSALGLAVGRVVPASLASVSVPLLLVVAGVLLLGRGRFRHRPVMILLAVGLLLVASSVSDSYRDVRDGESGGWVEVAVALPPLAGRTLVVETGASVDVVVGPGRSTVRAPSGGAVATPEVDGEEVILDGDDVHSYRLFVPVGTNVVVRGNDAPVRVEGRGGRTEIAVDDAVVDVSGWFDDLRIAADDARIDGRLAMAGADRRVEVAVDDARVDLRYDGDPALDTDLDDGRLDLDGERRDESLRRGGPDGIIRVRGDDARVSLVRVERLSTGLR